MRVGSLFSGYGGLDLAVEKVFGGDPQWFVEFSEAPSKILAHHWPDVPNLGDVTKIDWTAVPEIDILTGGSPCQDLSQAGRRAGMTEGTRSNLWVNMREAINQLRPAIVVWENVQGALSAKAASESDMESDEGQMGNLRALGRVLGDLAEIGYDAVWTTLRASDVGAPHQRARVFLIAYPSDSGSIGLEAGHERAGGLSSEVAGDNHRSGTLPRVFLPTPNASDGSGGGQHPAKRRGHSKQIIDSVIDMHYSDQPDKPEVETSEVFGRYTEAVRLWESLTRPAPHPTVLTGKGKPALNTKFDEWMMGLPEGHVTSPEIGLTRREQLQAIGNGVVPQQAEAAILQILDMIRNQQEEEKDVLLAQ